MNDTCITIPGNTHCFSADTYLVVTYDATTPTAKTVLEPSAITVNSETFDVTVSLAHGAILTMAAPDGL